MDVLKRVAGLGVGTALAVLGGSSIAEAAPAPVLVRDARGLAMVSSGTADMFAGYEVPSLGGASVSTTLTVPRLKCTRKSTEVDEIFVVIGGPGADEAGMSLELSCGYGDTMSLLTNEGAASDVTVSPGDVIQVSASTTASGSSESYTDETTGVIASSTGSAFTSYNVQMTIQGGWNDGGVFPGFSPLTFGSVMVNGGVLAATNPQAYDQVSATGATQITTGAIKQHGTSFTEKFVSG